MGDDFENDKRMFGAKTQVPCSPGTRARDMLVALAIVRTCERCPNGTISAAAADDCVSCDYGSRSSDDNTRCVEVVIAPGSGLDGDGGSSTNATDEYNNLLASYVAAARDNAKTPATAVGFFILLGVVATCCGLFTGWYRRRRIRLRQLALEREYLIEEAESDMQRGKPPRRATIYALAGKFILTFVRAIRMTSCFVYRCRRGKDRAGRRRRGPRRHDADGAARAAQVLGVPRRRTRPDADVR